MPDSKMTMTVQACCNGGRRLIYHIEVKGQPPMEITVDSGLDGKDAPLLVGGKPTGQTMAITQHLEVEELSPDGKTLTIDDEIAEPGGKTGKIVEKWVKQ